MRKFVVLLCLGFMALPAHALASARVALVIGNAAYRNIAHLPTPAKDAAAVAKMFEAAGFEVIEQHDVSNLEFKRAIRRFGDAMTDAEIAVVYYAGHGIEVKDTNYLVPVDAKLATDLDVDDETVSLDRLVQEVQEAGGKTKLLRLIILDACRDNPFVKTMKRARAGSGSRPAPHASGLQAIQPTGNDMLIAYAAKQGSTADDGNGEHSPFTQAILRSLTVPGLDIRLAFGRIRDDVLKATQARQEPFVYGSLGGGVNPLVPAQQAQRNDENTVRSDYERVAKIGTKKAFEVFVGTYKTGFYSDLARAQLAELSKLEQPKVTSEFELQRAERDAALSKLAEIEQLRTERAAVAQRAEVERQRLEREAARQRDEDARRAAVARLEATQRHAAVQPTQSSAATALQGRRVALVIGNTKYRHVAALQNPGNDAQLLAATLRSVGFQSVMVRTDLTREQLIQSLREFATIADSAEWAVVYYAGHGIEYGGANYMIPVDAQLRVDRDIDLETVDVGKVLSAIEGAQRLRLIILDACRDNPFFNQMRRTTASRSIGRGLARMEPEAGTLIVYAAKHGEVALDGDGKNGAFIEALVRRISQRPAQEVRRLFDLVRDDVMDATNRKQQPFSYGSLPGREDFYFIR